MLGSVQTQILAHTPLPTEHDPQAGNAPPPTPIPEMPVVTVDGNDYIGYLSVPSLGLELPIMSDWDYDKLQLAPCRQLGSVYTDDLVLSTCTQGGRTRVIVFCDRAAETASSSAPRHTEK